jgi:hypothetical protein
MAEQEEMDIQKARTYFANLAFTPEPGMFLGLIRTSLAKAKTTASALDPTGQSSDEEMENAIGRKLFENYVRHNTAITKGQDVYSITVPLEVEQRTEVATAIASQISLLFPQDNEINANEGTVCITNPSVGLKAIFDRLIQSKKYAASLSLNPDRSRF